MLSVVFFLLLFVFPAAAQDETAQVITYGGRVTGTLGNRVTRLEYLFEGMRGEAVAINVEVTAGNLDPVLVLIDEAGGVIATQDDGGEGRGVLIDGLRLPNTGRYTIVIGRFGYALGTTSGDFALTLERVGVGSESGSALRYGDSIANGIDDAEPQLYYTFQAQQGDILNISMVTISGDLDPYLQVVASDGRLIASNDDGFNGTSLDAEIENLLITEDGAYVIVATRWRLAAGDTSGTFILTLREADNSGIRNTPQAAEALEFNTPIEGELSQRNFTQYYTFDAQQNDLISVRMSRVGGGLDSFVIITDESLRELVSNDDSGGSSNAEIREFLVPSTGRYYVLATRFDRENGTSQGAYRLEVNLLGNAFDGVSADVPRITYGTTITGNISDATPALQYAFYGTINDAVTISMSRADGNLDSLLQLTDANGNVLVTVDDSVSGQDARIERYTLPATGIYYIRATRYSGTDSDSNTAGNFVLVLARRAN